jgi:hypothetical protein
MHCTGVNKGGVVLVVVVVVMVVALVVVVVGVVVMIISVVMVGKRGTTTINFNTLGVVVKTVVSVPILIALGLLYLNIFLVWLVVVLLVVE